MFSHESRIHDLIFDRIFGKWVWEVGVIYEMKC